METELDDRTYNLLFNIRRSVRYHLHRRRFYEGWNTVTMVIAVAGGAFIAAIASFLPPAWGWVQAAAGMVTLVAVLDLVVGTSRHANAHADFARRFIALEQRFAHDRNLDDTEHEAIVRERLAIESGEPPVLRLLDVISYHEVLCALDGKPPPQIPLWRRFAAHWISQLRYAQTLWPGAEAAG